MHVLLRRLSVRSLTLICCETFLIVSSVILAAYLRLGDLAGDVLVEEHGLLKAALIAAVAQTCLYYADLYDLRLLADRHELFIRIVQALASASFILAALYFWFPDLVIG